MVWRAVSDRLLREVVGYERWARRRGVTIGADCRILSNVVTSEPWLVSIGDRVTVSSDVLLVTHDGAGWLKVDEKGRRFRYAPIHIGSDVFVGARAIVLPGVKIGDKCVVGAGSVVTKSVPSGSVVAGNPARIVTSWDELMLRIDSWKSASEMVGATFMERVRSITDADFRPELGASRGS